MNKRDFITEVFKNKRTVFDISDIAFLLDESDFKNLKQKVNYYVLKRVILNLRRGIYAKENYNPEELAGKIFKPSYISLEYILQKAGVIFQYSESITALSYLTRTIVINGQSLIFRKIKHSILLNTLGITISDDGICIATPERAFLDLLYLNTSFYFDNISILDRRKVEGLLFVYNSKQLVLRVKKIFENAGLEQA
jgi:hypothetical protein